MAQFDIVIHSGRLIDGTGNPWFYGDVAIKDGKIAAVGEIGPESGQRAISAKGQAVAPGFIATMQTAELCEGLRRFTSPHRPKKIWLNSLAL